MKNANRKATNAASTAIVPTPEARENRLVVHCGEGEDKHVATATTVAGPIALAGLSFMALDKGQVGPDLRLQDYTEALSLAGQKLKGNDLSEVETMLLTQGMTLNYMITDAVMSTIHKHVSSFCHFTLPKPFTKA